jgi:DNA-binding transcriptional LysR family regulator
LENLTSLHWELSVLSKSVHYKNLSGAADHVGLSQPQLSRIVAKLEDALGVALLDRSARRKSGWTPVAFKVAETYARANRKLSLTLTQLTAEDQISHLSIGALEGLVPLANEFCEKLFEIPSVHHVELNVYDLSELEERFERDEIDMVFTSREPGKQKYKHVKLFGYQLIQKLGPAEGLKVYSAFDYAVATHQSGPGRKAQAKEGKGKANHRVLLSNSLSVRKHWIEEHGGTGFVPSEVRRKKTSDEDVPVILIASELFNPVLWQKIEQFRL